MSLSATAKELIQTILFNEVCNQYLAFYVFYKRKNCILTTRFHNRRVWRATNDVFFFIFFRSALRNFCTWILCITRRRAGLFSGLCLDIFAICLTIVCRRFEKQEIKHEKENRESLSKRSFTVIRLRRHVKSPFACSLPTWHRNRQQKL